MEPSKKKRSVALSSVLAGLLLTSVKLIVGLLTGSMGILSEALHSLLDFGAALLTYFAVRVGDIPPDESHHYGHGKVESVSALIETGLLFLTSFWIIYEAINRIITHDVEVEATWYAYGVMLLSIVVDISRSSALRKVAKETKSQALEADALHFTSDIFSSGVVILGLVFVSYGINIGDSIAAIIVSILVLIAGYRLGKRTIAVLMDAAPVGLAAIITGAASKIKGVIEIDKVRVRPAGPSYFAELYISVPRSLPLNKATEIAEEVEKSIISEIPGIDVNVVLRPVSDSAESIIEKVKIVARNMEKSIHDIVVHKIHNEIHISLDIEIDGKLPIKEAHSDVSSFEEAIIKEIGRKVVIHSHIEPLLDEVKEEYEEVNFEEYEIIRNHLVEITSEIKGVYNVHDIDVKKYSGKYFITLDCFFDDNISLEEAHKLSSSYEFMMKQRIEGIDRIVIHAEPLSEDDEAN